MKGKWKALAAIACAFALALGCIAGCSSGGSSSNSSGSSQAASTTRTVTDMRGRTVEIPQQIDRIVCVGITLRPVCYLQAQDKVVGVEQGELKDNVLCAYRHVNNEKFKDLPVIGEGGSGGITPNQEAIINAQPEVIICDGLEADEADSLQAATRIPVVCLDQPETFFDDDYYANLTFLGEVLNKQDRASEVVQYLKDTQADLQSRAAKSSKVGSVTAYAAGISYRGGHGFDGTEAEFPPFVSCNITNIADGKGSTGAYTIDLEAVSAAQPEYIFVESGNLSLVKQDYQNNPSYFSALDAVKNKNTYSLIAYRYYSTNVELAMANCYQVGAVVYPDSFSDVNPTQKLDEITDFMLGKSLSGDLAAAGYTFEQVDITAA